jgi:hypothetical protein
MVKETNKEKGIGAGFDRRFIQDIVPGAVLSSGTRSGQISPLTEMVLDKNPELILREYPWGEKYFDGRRIAEMTEAEWNIVFDKIKADVLNDIGAALAHSIDHPITVDNLPIGMGVHLSNLEISIPKVGIGIMTEFSFSAELIEKLRTTRGIRSRTPYRDTTFINLSSLANTTPELLRKRGVTDEEIELIQETLAEVELALRYKMTGGRKPADTNG